MTRSTTLFRSRALVFAALAVVSLAACGDRLEAKNPKEAPAGPEAQLMEKGLSFLYKTRDPDSAAIAFAAVLQLVPTHYGAHFQLAKALDAAGKPTEARIWWQKIKPMAEAVRDTATLRVADARLAQPDTVSQDAMMTVGLGMLYKTNNPAGAVAQFRSLIAKNPAHYGAHFQLAKALDASGQAAEGHKEWEKVLKMAEGIKDQVTADTARGRLKPVR